MGTNDEDVTIQILIEIRDEIRKTNERLDQTNARVESLETGFTSLRGEIKDSAREVELRLSTRFTELTTATRNVYDLLRDRFELRDRVEKCERDIEDLKRRAG